MSNDHKKLVTLSGVFLAVIAAGYFGLAWLKDVRDSSVYALQIKTIRTASGIDKTDDFHKRLDRLRVFINKNSQHKEDAEFYSLWRDKTKMAGAFVDYLEKRRTDKPHMECASRSGLMAAVLQSKGYHTRSLDAHFVEKDGKLISHVLLDVWNPHTKTWETQDPEYDVYWKDRKTGARTSMAVSGAGKTVIPCNAAGCGWSIQSREGNHASKLKKLTAYMAVTDRAAKERLTFYRPDIKPDIKMSRDGKSGTYCDVIGKNCRDGFLPSTTENLKRIMD